jgi:glycosyltransferase involved in cell wall biosynthesis
VVIAPNSFAYGGVEEHVVVLSTALAARGYEPVVVSAETEELRPLTERLDRAGVRHLGVDFRGGGLRPQLKATWGLVRAFAHLKPDVLHVHLVGYDGGRVPLLAGHLAHVPTVVTHHIAPPRPVPPKDYLARWPFLAGVKEFIAVSDANRKAQIACMRLPPDRLSRVHNGITLLDGPTRAEARAFLLSEFGIPDEAKVVGCVGRLAMQKGHKYLLEAAPEILRRVPNARFAFVGEGPFRERLERQAIDQGVAAAVHWLGFRSDVRRILPGIDVLAMPSEWEGLPIVLLEAMAAAVPVVAHAVDGIPEAVTDGQQGFLVARGDVPALTERITRLLTEPELARRMGRSAYERVVRDFTAARMAERIAALYEQAIARSMTRKSVSRRNGVETRDSYRAASVREPAAGPGERFHQESVG